MTTKQRPAAVFGWAAMCATVVLWASFALSSRALGESSLSVLDAAFLRFVTPLVLLAPRLPRVVRALRGERRAVVILLMAGGLPHFLVFGYGAHLTSAALTGMLVPGTVPLFVALLLANRDSRVSPAKGLGLAAISAGVAVSTVSLGSGAALGSIALLLTAGFVWAVYTIGLQRTGLAPLDVVLAVCAASSVGCVVLGVAGVLPSRLAAGSASLHDVAMILAVQGIGTGVLSTLCYAYAVRSLGSTLSSVAGAASPVLTAIVAVPLFGELVTTGIGIALILIVVGVLVCNLATGRAPAGRPARAVRAIRLRPGNLRTG